MREKNIADNMAKKPAKHPLSRYYPTYASVGLAVMLGVVSYFGLFHQQKAPAQDYAIRGFDVSQVSLPCCQLYFFHAFSLPFLLEFAKIPVR